MKFDEPLPTGWVLTSCSEFCSGRNQTFNPTRAAEDEFALYSVPSHETGKPETVRASDIGSTKQFVSAGDTLISKINPRLNRTWVVGRHPGKRIIASTEWIVFNQSPEFIPHFLAYFLQQGVVRDFLTHNASGVGGSLTRVRASIFEQVPFPLPPLAEQKRIVAKIEELFSELEAGEESLRVARRQLGVYRQSLLKQAFEGKLTAQWRTQNPDELESPDSLLARIQSARQSRYEQQIEEWKSSSGRKPRPPKAAPEVDLSELPSPWIWCRLSALSRVGTGVTPLRSRPEYYEDGNVPWITSTVVNEDVVHEPNGYVTQFALQDTQLQLYPAGSLIVALYGEGKTRGKVSQVAFDTTTNQALAVLVQEEECEKAIRPYLKLYLTKNYSDIRRLSSGGVQPNLNLGLIEQLPVPLCSLPEQQEIVRLLDEQFEVIERNEREIDAALKRSEALRQSILKEAFTGRLVPQDPSDEPASQLLARLRAHAGAPAEAIGWRKRGSPIASSV